MEECFTNPGRDTSGRKEGANVRGTFGRGAKDVPIFGGATYECVRDDQYARLEINDRGEGDFTKDSRGKTFVRCTPEIRARLGVRKGNGTVVTVSVTSNFTLKSFEWWCATFAKHFQLRDILSDPRRRVEIEEGDRRHLLQYKYPDGKLVLDKVLDVPGYPEAKPRLKVYQYGSKDTTAQLEEQKYTEYWEAGVLVKGRKAIFEKTFFERSLVYDPEAGRFFGELSCPHLDTLINEYRDYERQRKEHPAANNVLIVRRDRQGLEANHPFVEALYAVAGAELRAVMLARRATNKESVASEAMERRLDSVARAAERFLMELDEEMQDQDGGRGSAGLPQGLHLIPRVSSLPPGGNVVISLMGVGLSASPPGQPQVTFLPTDGLAYQPGEWTPSGDDSKNWRLPLKVRASEKLGTWAIHVRLEDRLVQGEVRVTTGSTPAPAEPPETLQFDHKRYGLGVGRPRSLRVMAPNTNNGDRIVHVHSDNPDFVVKAGGLLELRHASDPERLEGAIQLEARRAGARGTVFARMGDWLAKAYVSADGERGRRIAFGLTEKTQGSSRSWWEDLEDDSGIVRKLWITVRDKSVGRYLGRPVDGKWPDQDSLHFRMLLAEIFAEEVVREHLLRQSIRGQDASERGVPQILFEIQSFKQRFLPIAHQKMIPSPDTVRLPQ